MNTALKPDIRHKNRHTVLEDGGERHKEEMIWVVHGMVKVPNINNISSPSPGCIYKASNRSKYLQQLQ